MQAVGDDLLRALADPTRRAIFEHPARHGEHTAHVLTDHSGVSQPAVSKHLAALKHARLVYDRRDGRQTHHCAQPQALAPLIDWMSLYGVFWRDRDESNYQGASYGWQPFVARLERVVAGLD